MKQAPLAQKTVHTKILTARNIIFTLAGFLLLNAMSCCPPCETKRYKRKDIYYSEVRLNTNKHVGDRRFPIKDSIHFYQLGVVVSIVSYAKLIPLDPDTTSTSTEVARYKAPFSLIPTANACEVDCSGFDFDTPVHYQDTVKSLQVFAIDLHTEKELDITEKLRQIDENEKEHSIKQLLAKREEELYKPYGLYYMDNFSLVLIETHDIPLDLKLKTTLTLTSGKSFSKTSGIIHIKR